MRTMPSAHLTHNSSLCAHNVKIPTKTHHHALPHTTTHYHIPPSFKASPWFLMLVWYLWGSAELGICLIGVPNVCCLYLYFSYRWGIYMLNDYRLLYSNFSFEDVHIVVFIHGDDELHTIYRVLPITEILWFIYVYVFAILWLCVGYFVSLFVSQ